MNLRSHNTAALPLSHSAKTQNTLRCGWVELYIDSLSSLEPHYENQHGDSVFTSYFVDVNTHPSSVIPSINSFLVNSHWVAARNFHATTSTVMLAGSSERSSQNCWIPSIPILFSSWGSIMEKNNSCTKNKCVKHKIIQYFLENLYCTKYINSKTQTGCDTVILTFVAIVELLQLFPVYWRFHGFLTVEIWILKIVVGGNL